MAILKKNLKKSIVTLIILSLVISTAFLLKVNRSYYISSYNDNIKVYHESLRHLDELNHLMKDSIEDNVISDIEKNELLKAIIYKSNSFSFLETMVNPINKENEFISEILNGLARTFINTKFSEEEITVPNISKINNYLDNIIMSMEEAYPISVGNPQINMTKDLKEKIMKDIQVLNKYIELSKPPIVSPPTNKIGYEDTIFLENFIQLLKHKDSKSLLQLMIDMDSEYYSEYLEVDETFINNFIRLLEYDIELDSIKYEMVNRSDYSSAFQFKGQHGGTDVTLENLFYIIYEEGKITSFSWDYIRYAPFFERMANDYLHFIKLGDTKSLANFMSVDDLTYSEEKAKKIINIYRTYFDDIDSLNIIYNGNSQFIVRDKDNNSHCFHIAYGDGLMGIRDSFAPEPD